MSFVLPTIIAAALAIVMPLDSGRVVHANQDKDKKTVAGKWLLNVKSPHGEVGMALDLAQNGKKVTGTLATPHGDDLPVEGEFGGGTLTLATKRTSDSRITMTAKLKEEGTLDGYLSSQMGDMTWTGRRAATK